MSSNGASQELVDRSSSWGAQTYGKKIESDFSKYYFNSLTGGWEVTDRQGTVRYYGSAAASRQTNSYGTFKWFLDKVQDINENYMTLEYYTDTANGEVYLQEIDYTGNGALSATNKVSFNLSPIQGGIATSYASLGDGEYGVFLDFNLRQDPGRRTMAACQKLQSQLHLQRRYLPSRSCKM